jgi:pSer/pThr/pTyr-binding forkhead associated (FHA) protein
MQVYFKDVGSSSGTFLNHLRLSPSGKDSRPYPLSSEDVIQLGVDYQGRQEGMFSDAEIYKAVMIKIFIKRDQGHPVKTNRKRHIY